MITPDQHSLLSRQRIVDLSMRTVLPFLGVLVMMVGMLMVLIFALVPLVEHVRTQGWHGYPAVVERHAIEPHGSGLGRFFPAERIRYRYSVNGQEYVSQRGNLHQGVISGRSALRTRFVPGQTIQVWVNPVRPAHAVVNRSLDWGLIAFAIPGLALTVVGALMVFFGMLSWGGEEGALVPPGQ